MQQYIKHRYKAASEKSTNYIITLGDCWFMVAGTSDLLPHLRSMDDYEFEHLVADLWSRQGFETEVLQQSVDKGVDVRAVASRRGEKHLIQAKRYSQNTSVGGPDIQQYGALKLQEEGVNEVFVVTTGRVTKQASELAEEMGVKVINGDGLVSLINELDAQNIVANYIEEVPTPVQAALLDEFGEAKLQEIERSAHRMQRSANDVVPINGDDIIDLGIVSGFQWRDVNVDTERGRAIGLMQLAVEIDDIAIDENGEVCIADLSNYTDLDNIGTKCEPPILGIYDESVPDNYWTRTRVERAGNWHYGIIAALLGGYVTFFGFTVVNTHFPGATGILSGLALAWASSIFIAIICTIIDISHLKKLHSKWNPSYAIYLIGGFLTGGLVMIWYMMQRVDATHPEIEPE